MLDKDNRVPHSFIYTNPNGSIRNKFFNTKMFHYEQIHQHKNGQAYNLVM